MKKLISVIMATALAGCLLIGCASGTATTTVTSATASAATASAEETTAASVSAETSAANDLLVGVAMNAADEYGVNWLEIFTQNIEAAGGKVISTNAEMKADKQLADIDSLIAQQPDVILVKPIDAEGIVSGLQAVNKAGIELIVFDGTLLDAEGYNPVVDQGINGRLLGEYLNKWLDEEPGREANVGYIVGMYADIVMPRMTEIFTTCPRAVKVAEAEGSWNADKGMKITEDWLQSHPEINVIAAMNDEMAIGAVQALIAAGKNMDDYLVLGVDGTLNGQTSIQAGELDATTWQDMEAAVGQIAEAAIVLGNGGEYNEPMDPSVIHLMTKENIDQLIGSV